MNDPLRMEYMHLLPWRRSGKENGDEEMGYDEDNLSECESQGSTNPRGSAYSLDEGDLRILGLFRDGSDTTLEMDGTGVRFSGTTINQQMMIAIEESDASAVELCIRNGADPNSQFSIYKKVTALHLATEVGTLKTVQVLLKNGARVNSADARGVTSLHLAAGLGLADIAHRLITAGADVNAQDLVKENGNGLETPLHRAATCGHLEVLRTLLLSGAQVDIVEARGWTPLHCASHRGATGCIQSLLDFKADPNLVDKQGATALLLLGGGYLLMKDHGVNEWQGYDDSAKVLVKGGANVNVKDPNSGVTPLHQSVLLGREDATKLFIEHGAELLAKDMEGGTAIHACALKGHVGTLKLLLAQPHAKEAVNLADTKGRMPLHKAAYRGSPECIQLLLQAGADLGAETKTGSSAATLILQSPNGTKILSKQLNKSIITKEDDDSEVPCMVTFDYSILLSKHKFQQMGVIEDILDDKQKHQTAELFQHPVIESFLCLKWRKIRLLFFSNILLYLILVAGVTAYVLSTVSSEASTVPGVPINQSTEKEMSDFEITSRFATEKETVVQLQLSLNIIILIIIFQETIQFASLHYQYFREAESWIKLVALISSTVVIFSSPPWPDWVHHLSAVAVLFGWSEVTFLLGRLPTFGVYALMFYSVAQHLMKFIFVFIFFLAGFSFSFYLMFTKIHNSFNSPWMSLLRTFAMMLGDTNYDEYLAEGKYNLEGTAHVIYFFFLVLVSLILMNLLIGLAVNDIQGLQTEGQVKRLRKQAQFIVYLENIVSNRFLRWVLCCSGVDKKLNSWINLEPFYTFSPVRRKIKTILPANIVERVVAIVQEGRIPEFVTANETYSLLQECAKSITDLRQRMENLERGLLGTQGIIEIDAGSAEMVTRGGEIQLGTGNPEDSEHSIASDKDLSHDEDINHGDQDVVGGAYIRNKALLRRTTMRTIRAVRTTKSVKSSIRSELDEIKRMLIPLTSK